jgi:hypothetical protein
MSKKKKQGITNERKKYLSTLLKPIDLAKKINDNLNLGISLNARHIARLRLRGLPVAAIVAGRPLYDPEKVFKWFEKQADKENLKKEKKQIKKGKN